MSFTDTVSHYCLKCKKSVDIIVERVEQAENGSNRWYAVGDCPGCTKSQKRQVSKEWREMREVGQTDVSELPN